MKKHFLILFCLTVLFQNVNAQKGTTIVGTLENGKPTLTIDKSRILRIYNANLLKFSGIDGKFTNVELIPNQDGNYVLLFSGTSWRSAIGVKPSGNQLVAFAKTSCSTSDCSEERLGCIVHYEFLGDEIGLCTKCSNGGKCTKTSTSETMLDE